LADDILQRVGEELRNILRSQSGHGEIRIFVRNHKISPMLDVSVGKLPKSGERADGQPLAAR